jgi:hypothetical protein
MVSSNFTSKLFSTHTATYRIHSHFNAHSQRASSGTDHAELSHPITYSNYPDSYKQWLSHLEAVVAAADVVEVVTVEVAVASPPEVVAADSAEVAAVVTVAAVEVAVEVVVVVPPEAVALPVEEAVAEPELVEEPRSLLSPIATQVFSSLAERRISLSPRT